MVHVNFREGKSCGCGLILSVLLFKPNPEPMMFLSGPRSLWHSLRIDVDICHPV